MAIIHGQIESLKKLKNELASSGIDRFKSVKEITDFLHNFEYVKEVTINNIRHTLESEIKDLTIRIKENKDKIESVRSKTITDIQVHKDLLEIKIDKLSAKANKSSFHKLICNYFIKRKRKSLDYYATNPSEIIENALKSIRKVIENDENNLLYLINNKELIINNRSIPEIQKLSFIKDKIEDLKPIIAGAVGEDLVLQEIEKLPDSFILINDYSLKFTPPIYNKNTKDRILSIQIDHLLIAQSGIFILETKNWSKESIESSDLRSPVEQITRSSYALFILVNNAKIELSGHHWGDKQIPIRNIVVLINGKPKEDFKYVRVKTINELNNYITYLGPVFSEEEVNRIAKFLIEKQHQ